MPFLEDHGIGTSKYRRNGYILESNDLTAVADKKSPFTVNLDNPTPNVSSFIYGGYIWTVSKPYNNTTVQINKYNLTTNAFITSYTSPTYTGSNGYVDSYGWMNDSGYFFLRLYSRWLVKFDANTQTWSALDFGSSFAIKDFHFNENTNQIVVALASEIQILNADTLALVKSFTTASFPLSSGRVFGTFSSATLNLDGSVLFVNITTTTIIHLLYAINTTSLAKVFEFQGTQNSGNNPVVRYAPTYNALLCSRYDGTSNLDKITKVNMTTGVAIKDYYSATKDFINMNHAFLFTSKYGVGVHGYGGLFFANLGDHTVDDVWSNTWATWNISARGGAGFDIRGIILCKGYTTKDIVVCVTIHDLSNGMTQTYHHRYQSVYQLK